jgi:hypothetical protein
LGALLAPLIAIDDKEARGFRGPLLGLDLTEIEWNIPGEKGSQQIYVAISCWFGVQSSLE